uniref:Uncharacterized protein n=1 Tax=Salix viminalis TaxID=40686 RepID=A0A6N2LAU0_SALVM
MQEQLLSAKSLDYELLSKWETMLQCQMKSPADFIMSEPCRSNNIVIVLEMVTFAGANSDGNPMGEPAASLLCISDCVTCPVICSPPPPLLYHPSPPSHHSPSPQHSYHSLLPPPPPPTSPSTSPPPPPTSPSTSPPAYHSPPQSPQAPSCSPIWAAPPPPGYYFNTPKGQAPPGKGPYPYPYYYFYSSKASSFSLHASHFFSLGVFHVVYLLF